MDEGLRIQLSFCEAHTLKRFAKLQRFAKLKDSVTLLTQFIFVVEKIASFLYLC